MINYVLFASLVLYGLFFRITSSEFWPMTISKTWLHPDRFEYSMLQKPLLTLVLAVFHIFDFSDVVHVLMVKLFFSLISVIGLYYFSSYALTIAKLKKKSPNILIVAIIFALSSHLYQNYFFSIRSDQLATLLFISFLIFCQKNNILWALVSLLAIPLAGVKEIIFLIPGFIFFYINFKRHISIKLFLFLLIPASALIIWILALNYSAFVYFKETLTTFSVLDKFSFTLLSYDLGLMASLFLSYFYILFKNRVYLYKYMLLSLCFLMFVFLIPQNYEFFLASLLPFIYLPLLILLIELVENNFLYLSAIFLNILIVFTLKYLRGAELYQSNYFQLSYIEKASQLLHQHKLNYLDGMGMLPKQTNIVCFVSPYDAASNNNCIYQVKNSYPDSIIMTNRLANLSSEIQPLLNENYTQIYANLYIQNKLVTDELKSKINLSGKFGLPILIF